MNKLFDSIGGVALLTVVLLIICYGLSWIMTCGLIKLVTLCFGWAFKWSIATGIWLVMCLAKTVFTHTVTVKTK